MSMSDWFLRNMVTIGDTFIYAAAFGVIFVLIVLLFWDPPEDNGNVDGGGAGGTDGFS